MMHNCSSLEQKTRRSNETISRLAMYITKSIITCPDLLNNLYVKE